MPFLLSFLFAVCSLAALGLAFFVYLQHPRSAAHRYFAAGSLFLVGWLVTLYVFDRESNLAVLTLLGRVNIALMLPVVVCAYLLIRSLLQAPVSKVWVLWSETVVLAILTILTPAIDRQEIIQGGQHVTLFGPWFILNILHVVGYLGAAILTAMLGARSASRWTRAQLAVLAVGLFVTMVVAVTCDLILPYRFHIFALQEVGALSTLVFLGAVGYAIVSEHLFNARLVIRTTLVLTVLIASFLELYSAAVEAIAKLVPLGDPTQRHITAATLTLIINVLTQEPLRRWLERLADRLLQRKKR